MVYDKLRAIKERVKLINGIVLLALLLGGCGAVQTLPGAKIATNAKDDTSSVNGDSKIPLLPTLKYIPVLKTDKKGKAVPYIPAENPYLVGSIWVSRETTQAYQRAKQALISNDLADAKQQLHYLRNNNAKLSGPWVMLGDISLKEKAPEQAQSHYQKAISINKRNINAYLRLAKVQRIQGQFSMAQNTYAKLLAIWSDFPEAHLNLGVLYDVYLNDPVKAQKHIEAYQFLTHGKNTEVAAWLRDLQKRTGVETSLGSQNQTVKTTPVS